MSDTRKLLADYVTHGSETAFREVVARYTDLVYSTALRLVEGDSHLAQDVAQTVFVDLARKAQGLSQEVTLGGWLHRHTCFVASTILRGQRRRLHRERQAVIMNTPDNAPANLALVAPILDEAINQLNSAERAAIVLRFFEQKDFRAVGEITGSSEDAARMRVNRALEKLHSLLKNRGVTCSAALLGAALAAEAVSAAPLGMAAMLAGNALAAAGMGGAAVGVVKFMAMTKLKIAVAGAVLVALIATPVVVQQGWLKKARVENAELRQKVDQLAALQAENEQLSNTLSAISPGAAPSQSQIRELARLRNEVGMLREKTNEMGLAAEKNTVLINGMNVANASGFRGGKRVFRGITMAEFAQFMAGVLAAPVTDQTGLTGTYDIAMTPPRSVGEYQKTEKVAALLLNELGLQMVAYSGPFTTAETLAAGAYPPAKSGYALRLDHHNATGLKPATDANDPFGLGPDDSQLAAASVQTGTAGATDDSLSDEEKATHERNACVNNLRLIDAAKQQWALEYSKTASATPEWTDIQPYLGRGATGQLPECPSGGSYTIGAVSEIPKCTVDGHVLH